MEKGDDKQLNDEDTQNKYPYNVTFRTEDFAAETAGRTAREVEKYDVVLCLSVTKWVHLTGGDVALKRLFSRMHSCLRPGGVLILEPQLKRSYKIARKKGVVSMKNRHFGNDLKLRPDLFGQYLLSEEGGGFESMSMLRDVRGKGYSFNRPIMAFYKGGAGGVRGDVVARKGLSCRQRRALKESQNKAFYAARGNDGCDVQICEEEEIKR